MRKITCCLTALTAVLALGPLSAVAQQADEPETHIMTITTFYVPLGLEREAVMDYIDEYVVPPAKGDPNVLGFRVAVHNWGTNQRNVWLMTEYESLAALDASNEWGNAWFEENYPEGSAEREAADKAFEEVYAPYFSKHTDNIVVVNMDRAK